MDAERTVDIDESVKSLVDAWCDRRCLSALRHILQGWPLSSRLTDDWAQLLEALQSVRALAKDELTEEEAATVGQLITATEKVVYRR